MYDQKDVDWGKTRANHAVLGTESRPLFDPLLGLLGLLGLPGLLGLLVELVVWKSRMCEMVWEEVKREAVEVRLKEEEVLGAKMRAAQVQKKLRVANSWGTLPSAPL